MNYAQRLERLREFQKRAGTAVSKVPEPPFDTSDTALPGHSEKSGVASDTFDTADPGHFQKNKDAPGHGVNPLHGLPLLKEDALFVDALTSKRDDKAELLVTYREKWLAASESEPVPHKKDNKGRFAANSWLRETTGLEVRPARDFQKRAGWVVTKVSKRGRND